MGSGFDYAFVCVRTLILQARVCMRVIRLYVLCPNVQSINLMSTPMSVCTCVGVIYVYACVPVTT